MLAKLQNSTNIQFLFAVDVYRGDYTNKTTIEPAVYVKYTRSTFPCTTLKSCNESELPAHGERMNCMTLYVPLFSLECDDILTRTRSGTGKVARRHSATCMS